MTTAPQPAVRPSQVFGVMLRGAFLPSLAAGALAVLIAWVLRGGAGALSGLLGLIIALAFFASGMAIMARIVREANPLLFMAAALSVYMGQMIVVLLVFVAVGEIAWLDNLAVGLAILVVALVWQVASMIAWRRARVAVYDPAEPAASAPVGQGPR